MTFGLVFFSLLIVKTFPSFKKSVINKISEKLKGLGVFPLFLYENPKLCLKIILLEYTSNLVFKKSQMRIFKQKTKEW